MTLVSAVIAVSILAGLAVLVVIPILIVLYYRKHRQTQRLQHRLDMQLVEVSKKQTSMPSSHVNSLPCRLKKKPSSAGGSRSAAGESGVYDMSEISQLTESPSKHHAVTATYAGSDGTPHKLYLYGDLSSDDHLVVKEVISHHIHMAQDTRPSSLSPRESRISSQQSVIASSHNTDSLTIPDLHCTSRASLSLDDITITGLDNSHISYENEGYRKDEHENLNGTSKRRQQVKKTISALSNRMRMNIKREDKSSSRLSDSACHSPYATQKSAVIGQSGGEIILSGGVKLSIPPHALSDKVQITLGVTFDPRHQPHVSVYEICL
ncbi:hypothetical protein EB796_002418 [Bugula neritina]|uniref:Uncharacterized protein n=1 Tax=Bugula neritina TaxID=10212 RepID=A0A7J7KM95_BUGNE|nr:hypothetical protein EB796_002418 [Bugula neritina]